MVAAGELFGALIPEFQPLFVSLPSMDIERLESEAGYLGWVLELIQQRHARPEEYAALVRGVTEHLEKMPRSERERWLQLLSYVRARGLKWAARKERRRRYSRQYYDCCAAASTGSQR
jgi:hypothetical protein